MKKYLELRFIYAYPLDVEMREQYEQRGLEYPSIEVVKETVVQWRQLWQEVEREHSMLSLLSELTKRTPTRALECFVFGAGLQAKSTPLILPIMNRNGEYVSNQRFVEMIIHELLHIYLTTNNKSYWEYATKKYANEAPVTQNHILLYAFLYKIYNDAWEKEPLDFGRDNLSVGYARAIQIVREEGYEHILSEYEQVNNC